MISEYFSSIQELTFYAIIFVIVSFLLFVIALIWVIRLDKKYVNYMENIPFDSNRETKNNSEKKDEVNQ